MTPLNSWVPMREALDYARKDGTGSLYQEVFFNRQVKFQYPPTALLPMLGLQSLGVDTTNVLLNNINRALLVMNAMGIGWLFTLVLARTNGEEAAASPAGRAGAVLTGISTLLFYPVMMAFWLGQIQIWIDTGFTFACVAILSNRRLAAGVLVGLLCLIKPQFSLFALWALRRSQWRFLLGAAIAIVPCALISLAIFGLTAHIDYLSELRFLSERGEAMIANNSVNGILNALLGTADPLVFDAHGFPTIQFDCPLGQFSCGDHFDWDRDMARQARHRAQWPPGFPVRRIGLYDGGPDRVGASLRYPGAGSRDAILSFGSRSKKHPTTAGPYCLGNDLSSFSNMRHVDQIQRPDIFEFSTGVSLFCRTCHARDALARGSGVSGDDAAIILAWEEELDMAKLPVH